MRCLQTTDGRERHSLSRKRSWLVCARLSDTRTVEKKTAPDAGSAHSSPARPAYRLVRRDRALNGCWLTRFVRTRGAALEIIRALHQHCVELIGVGRRYGCSIRRGSSRHRRTNSRAALACVPCDEPHSQVAKLSRRMAAKLAVATPVPYLAPITASRLSRWPAAAGANKCHLIWTEPLQMI